MYSKNREKRINQSSDITELKTSLMKDQRGLGLGFGEGNTFHLFSHEPNRGLINNLTFTDDFFSEASKIIKHPLARQNKTALSALTEAVKIKLDNAMFEQVDEIVKDILALTIPDLLIDINITRLQKIMPFIIGGFSNEIKNIFAQYKLNLFKDDAGKRFLRSIVVSKYELFSDGNIEDKINKKILKIEENLTIDKIHLIDSEIMAYLMPALLDRMKDEDLRKISYSIASQLNSKYLLAIADKNYFIPDISSDDNDKVSLKNVNKRSLQFFTHSSNTRIHFRGTDYTLQHTHIHFEKDGEENEYDLDGQRFDGEIHTVFEFNHKGNPKKKRLMAIGFPVKISSHDNPKFTQLLNSINHLEEVKHWRASSKTETLSLDMKQLDMFTNYKNLFMEHFDLAKSKDSLLFHSWASLRSNTYGFRAGLRFVISSVPITMSETQYMALKEIFGEMNKNLKEEDKLDPVDRKAGFRKQRLTIRRSLEEKVVDVSNQNLLRI